MSVTVKISPAKIQIKMDNVWKNGLAMLSSEILNDCNEYCKMDTGMLIASSYIHSKLDEGKLIWQTPYARRQYYKIRTAHPDKRSKATWKWCEAAKARHRQQWARAAQKIVEMMK